MVDVCKKAEIIGEINPSHTAADDRREDRERERVKERDTICFFILSAIHLSEKIIINSWNKYDPVFFFIFAEVTQIHFTPLITYLTKRDRRLNRKTGSGDSRAKSVTLSYSISRGANNPIKLAVSSLMNFRHGRWPREQRYHFRCRKEYPS